MRASQKRREKSSHPTISKEPPQTPQTKFIKREEKNLVVKREFKKAKSEKNHISNEI
jgi:hypothetical protein